MLEVIVPLVVTLLAIVLAQPAETNECLYRQTRDCYVEQKVAQ